MESSLKREDGPVEEERERHDGQYSQQDEVGSRLARPEEDEGAEPAALVAEGRRNAGESGAPVVESTFFGSKFAPKGMAARPRCHNRWRPRDPT